MLTRTRFRDYSRFPQPPGKQGLAQSIVYLVRARMVQIFTFKIDFRSPAP
jgi:hypothetical protein